MPVAPLCFFHCNLIYLLAVYDVNKLVLSLNSRHRLGKYIERTGTYIWSFTVTIRPNLCKMIATNFSFIGRICMYCEINLYQWNQAITFVG